MATPLAELIAELQSDHAFALEYLFPERHSEASAPFHNELVRTFASDEPRVLISIFRGAGKSTKSEEMLTFGALVGEFRYAIILGNTYSSAVDRLASIRNLLENNERIQAIFGSVRGDSWTESSITLTNGVRIDAYGRGQSVRGAKSAITNARPDMVLADDIEDAESVATPEARQKTWKWLMREVTPALDPKARVRILGTPLHEDSLTERLRKSANWKTFSYPVYTMDDTQRVPTWPARFPLDLINRLEEQYRQEGDLAGWSQEYLITPMDSIASIFQRHDIIIADKPQIGFAPKLLIVDPARTTNQRTSARTGYIVASWVGNQLYVHEAIGAFDTPAEQIARIFELSAIHQPMTVAVEEDGLNQWLMQPLRAEMVRRGTPLPLQAIRAPKGKDDFIRGLQPFFAAHEVTFAKSFPDLEAEMASFPLGRKDIINALAYAIRLRPGMPVYPSFTSDHILHKAYTQRADWYIFLNATQGQLYAILAMSQDGSIHIVRDWVMEGSLDESLRTVMMGASTEMPQNKRPTIFVPYDRTLVGDLSGLPATLKRMNIQTRTGKRLADSAESLEMPLRVKRGVTPMLTVSPEATWTLNALAGGYCRDSGTTNFFIRESVHKHVAQALESAYAALGGYELSNIDRSDVVYSTTSTGRQFISMRR